MTTCPKCQAKNDESARYCISCGQLLRKAGWGRPCPAGRHTIDPNWTHCPYCEAEASLQPPKGEKEKVAMRNKTSYGDDEEIQRRRVTKMDEEQGRVDSRAAEARESAPAKAKIVGLLLSFSRDPAGEIFPIREGRNAIGSGEATEGEPCDILFPEDRKMSGFHAMILYRRGRCYISDQLSTNGTFVNNQEVDKIELPNYAHLRLGKTEFVFIRAQANPPAQEETVERLRDRDDEELVRKPSDRSKREPPLV